MGRLTIAVVDDQPEFAELLGDVLREDGGYAVRTFTDAPGIDELTAAGADVVLLDLLLGGEATAGWGLLRRIRGAASPLSRVPVVICSADVMTLRERERELAAVPAVFVLQKPFGLDELQSVIRQAIGAERLATEEDPSLGRVAG